MGIKQQECHSKYARYDKLIDDRLPGNSQMMFVIGDHQGSVIYPVVVIDGIKCRALLDTGAGSTYMYPSAALFERLNKHPRHIKHEQIEMMLQQF